MIEAHFDACNTEIWADEAETSNFEFCEKLPGGASALWRVSLGRRLALVYRQSKLFKTNFDF
jgi:hypothetical protein